MRHPRLIISIFVVLAVFMTAEKSSAYPTYIAKGYTSCATCHYSPTGGGLPNSYGHGTISAMFPDSVRSDFLEELRKKAAKNDVTGFTSGGKSEFQWDLGLDTRLMFIPATTSVTGEEEITFIPMLVEVGGVTAYGPWLLYGTVTPRRSGAERTPDTIFSREHWLQYKFNDRQSLRGGRIVLPFGLRIPDHTQYTREDLGFGQWGQSYGVEWDYYDERWLISAAGFFGDLILDPTEIQQRGGVFSITRHVADRASFGSSFLFSASEAIGRTAGSVFLRYRPWKRIYGMGEATPFYDWGRKNSGSQFEVAGLLRAGWFPMESLDLFFEWGARGIESNSNLTKYRYMWGVNWQVLPWIELSPAVFLEEDDTGQHFTVFTQIHAIF